ncbi:MAG: phosphotransferase [Candidatus Cryosericum sp.]
MKRAIDSGSTDSIEPRIGSITCALTPAERLPPMSLDPMALRIPPQILAVTGPVVHRSSPYQGRSGLVLLLQNAAEQRFVLKVARGTYRMQELALEYEVLKLLHETEIPVPKPLVHVQNRPLGFLLMEHAVGRSATDVLREAGSRDDRDRIAVALGSLLSALHHLPVGTVSWQECVDGQLLWAERHLEEKVMSRAEFRAKGITGDPVKELERLRATCPAPGVVAVLHGDFRPKNILLEGDQITSVLDWSFTDLGDPWYDLSTIFGYLDSAGQQVFLNAYGLEAVDRDRLEWFRSLSVYLAV